MARPADSAHRLTYRDALRLAPVAYYRYALVTIEGRCTCNLGTCPAVMTRVTATGEYLFLRPDSLERPNPAARKLMEALR